MKKTWLAAGAAIILFASCKEMSATKYNDTVVNLYGGYISSITADISSLDAADKAKASASAVHLEKLTDSCIGVMNGLKPSEDAKEFHNAEMGVYNLMKTELVPLIKKMADAKGNEDAYNKLVDPYNALTDKLDKAETAAQTAQQAFAAKLGMQVR